MLRSLIKPGVEYALRERRSAELQRVKILEHIRENKWKAEWINPNPGLVHFVESGHLLVPWKEHKAFLREEADAAALSAHNDQQGYERDSPLDNAVCEIFESTGEREVSCWRGQLAECEAEKKNFQLWRRTVVNLERLKQWIDDDLKKVWGFKAATRAFHIVSAGRDVTIVGPYKGHSPTTIPVSTGEVVPGAAGKCQNLFDLSQVLAWLCVDDAEGDSLDAVLAAVQAAWSWVRREDGYGVPQDCDPGEGWIVDPATQPSVNSSITRVRPVFRQLLGRDPTGRSWLPQILCLSKSNGLSGMTSSEPGNLLGAISQKRPYADPVQGNIELERCFEFSVPPGASFLRWLLENPNRLTWPGAEGHRLSYGATTQARREALVGLISDSAKSEAQASALRSLARNGPARSSRQWWAFEGFTEVDCCLETDEFVLLIEGKRTESLSESTAWYSGRNQLHRNLEAARDLAAGREFGVLVIGEKEISQPALGNPEVGLPHLATEERAELMTHYLGCLMWRQVCEATGVDYDSLPRNVARRVKR